MPKAAPRPCAYPGCRSYAVKSGKCANHQPEPWASNNGKSRHARGYGTAWNKLRVSILKRDQGLCQSCARAGIVTAAKTVDHIINKAKGGTDHPTNLEAICDACHTEKTQKESIEGRENG